MHEGIEEESTVNDKEKISYPCMVSFIFIN